MGGVVNLVARRPIERAREFIVNRSSRGETDALGYVSQPFSGGWGGTLVAGGHWHEQNDIDGDGWADLPSYGRAEIRPRVFWDNHRGSSLFVTAGATRESRTGGTVDGAVIPATNAPYREMLDTGRYDFGFVGQTLLSNRYVISVRSSGTWLSHDHAFGDVRERDTRDTFFGEVSARQHVGRHMVVVGAAIDRDRFNPKDVPQFGYAFTTPGVFAQDDVDVTPWLAVSGSVRLDHHNVYGTFLSPRVSALFRSGGLGKSSVSRYRILSLIGAHGRNGSGRIVAADASRTTAGGNRAQCVVRRDTNARFVLCNGNRVRVPHSRLSFCRANDCVRACESTVCLHECRH